MKKPMLLFLLIFMSIMNAQNNTTAALEVKDGDKGRGGIFILPIEECVRIRTGETGSVAIE